MSLLLACVGAALAQAGPEVTLSGVVSHTGSGALRLEVLLMDEEGGAPLLVKAVALSGAGPFAVAVPAELGQVKLRVAYDPDQDGVGPEDPQAVSLLPIRVGLEDVGDLQLSLRRPDLRGPTKP